MAGSVWVAVERHTHWRWLGWELVLPAGAGQEGEPTTSCQEASLLALAPSTNCNLAAPDAPAAPSWAAPCDALAAPLCGADTARRDQARADLACTVPHLCDAARRQCAGVLLV
ncbi:MAG: hypothetical protein KDA41_19425 [Planctomycetales bacterium]|nr:hypothetical protein [Planctomycetales bacterium]